MVELTPKVSEFEEANKVIAKKTDTPQVNPKRR